MIVVSTHQQLKQVPAGLDICDQLIIKFLWALITTKVEEIATCRLNNMSELNYHIIIITEFADWLRDRSMQSSCRHN